MLAVVKSSAERGIEVRTDWPEPTAGPGQVLLQVAAAVDVIEEIEVTARIFLHLEQRAYLTVPEDH